MFIQDKNISWRRLYIGRDCFWLNHG